MDMTSAATQRRGFLPLVGLLYVSQGLPMGLSMEALPVLMREAGVPLEVIAWAPLAGLPWVLKLLWAPMVENRDLGGLGRRRGWILWGQALLALSLLAIGFTPLSGWGIWAALSLLTLGCLASATQDTATDGLVAESLSGASLAQANALQVGGLMAGFLIGGALALVLSGILGQRATLAILALIPLASLLLALSLREEARPARRIGASLRASFRRPGVWRMMGLAVIFGGAHAGGLSVSRLLLIDKGWSLSEAGLMGSFSGVVLVLAGCPLGAFLAARSRWATIAAGTAVAAGAFLWWAGIGSGVLAADWPQVLGASALLSLASGLIAVAAFTLIMAFGGEGEQAGVDVTMLQSASVSGEMFFAGLAVWCAGAFGYGASFSGAAAIVAILTAVLALALLREREMRA